MRAPRLTGALLVAGLVAIVLVSAPGAAEGHDEMPPIVPFDVTADPGFGEIDESTDEVSFVVHLYRWTPEHTGPYTMTFEVDSEPIAIVEGFWEVGTRHVNVSTVEDAEEGPGVWGPSLGLHWLNVTTEADGKDWTLPVRLPLGPNLAPTALDTGQAQVMEGDAVTFEATVKNHGSWSTPQGEPIPVTLLKDAEPIAETTLTHIPSRESATATFEDAWTALPGAHEWTIRVDPDAVDELATSDNEATFTIDVEAAGLMVDGLEATPNPASPGEPVTVTASITNQGDEEEPPSLVHLATNGDLTHETSTPRLAPGEGTNVTWTIQPDIGLHELQGALEPHDEEAPRAPNGPTTRLLVGPDLSIERLIVQPAEPVEGQPVTVTATLTNHGTTMDAAIPLVLHAEEDADNATTQNMDGTKIQGLDADEQTHVTLNATLEPGTYTMTVDIDPLGSLEEATREGNTAQTSLFVRVNGTDLILDRFNLVPKAPTAGDTVRIEADILNQGAQPGTGYNARILTDQETLHDDALPELAPGASTSLTTTWTPKKGTQIVTVLLGTDDQIAQGDPHHVFTREITVQATGPILELSNLRTDPSTPTIGDQAQAMVNVTNTGDEASGPVEIRFEADEAIDTVTVENLEPGETQIVKIPWTPTSTAWSLEATAQPATDNTRSLEATNATITGEGIDRVPLPGLITLLMTLLAAAGRTPRRT